MKEEIQEQGADWANIIVQYGLFGELVYG